MARAKDFHDLIVWQKAMLLARLVYAATEGFPKSETFGLRSQIRRAVVSIAANIAEGHGRLSDLQFRHFLGNARGSLSELQTEIELAHDLKMLSAESLEALMGCSREVARLLNGLIASMPGGSVTQPNSQKITNSASSANNASSAQRPL